MRNPESLNHCQNTNLDLSKKRVNLVRNLPIERKNREEVDRHRQIIEENPENPVQSQTKESQSLLKGLAEEEEIDQFRSKKSPNQSPEITKEIDLLLKNLEGTDQDQKKDDTDQYQRKEDTDQKVQTVKRDLYPSKENEADPRRKKPDRPLATREKTDLRWQKKLRKKSEIDQNLVIKKEKIESLNRHQLNEFGRDQKIVERKS